MLILKRIQRAAIGGFIALPFGGLALWIVEGEAAAKFAAVILILIGITAGIFISIWEEKKERRERDEERQREERRRRLEVQRRKDHFNSKCKKLTNRISEASTHLDNAEREFEERAFALFWDEVGYAINKLSAYHKRVKKLEHHATEYALRDSELGMSVSDMLEGELPDARLVAVRLSKVVRQAQRDFEFAMIYEQRQTNQLLYAGFGTLASAIDSLQSLIGDALEDLATSLNTTLGDLVSASNAQADTLNVLSEHVAGNAEAQRGFERDSLAESKRQSEMLDNITEHQAGTAESLRALLRDIEGVIALYEDASGAAASRTRYMIERDGAVNALSTLAVSVDLEKEFRVLRDRGQLDHSFEALIGKYPCLFSNDVVEAARWRLDNADRL